MFLAPTTLDMVYLKGSFITESTSFALPTKNLKRTSPKFSSKFSTIVTPLFPLVTRYTSVSASITLTPRFVSGLV